MTRIQDPLDFFQADTRIFHVTAHPIRVGLKRFEGKFGSGRAKREVVAKKIIMPIDVSHGENLQRKTVVPHQVSDAGIGVDHHFVRETGNSILVESF
jgi:hypothetical protein